MRFLQRTQLSNQSTPGATQSSRSVRPKPPISETKDLPPVLHEALQLPVSSTVQPVQPKLIVGSGGDQYEQEADRMAQQAVIQINSPRIKQLQPEKISKVAFQMKPLLQHQTGGDTLNIASGMQDSIEQMRGTGQPLANAIRKPMERAFGADFGRVRIHANAESHQLNQSVQALAFTTRQDIFFRQGAYQPDSSKGQAVIAHELAHVIQQRSANPINNLLIQRITYQKGILPGSWQGYCSAWRDDKAEELWKEITRLYDKVKQTISDLQTGTELEQAEAQSLQTQLDELDKAPIPYSKAQATIDTLKGIDAQQTSDRNAAKNEWAAIGKMFQEVEKSISKLNGGSRNEKAQAREFQNSLTTINKQPILLKQAQATISTLTDLQTKSTSAVTAQEKRLESERNEKKKKEKKEKQAQEQKESQQKWEEQQQQLNEKKAEEEARLETLQQEKANKLQKDWQNFNEAWTQKVAEVRKETKIRGLIYNWDSDFNKHFTLEGSNEDRQPPDVEKNFASARSSWITKSNNKELAFQIDEVVKQAIEKGLNSKRANQIGDDGKRNKVPSATVSIQLDEALQQQLKPDVSKWRTFLGMDAYVVTGELARHEGKKIHVTFDKNSVKQPGSITGKTAEELTDALLSVRDSDYGIHATLEANELTSSFKDGFINPHYYWGGNFLNESAGQPRYSGDEAAAKMALKNTLETYVENNIRKKVQEAIDRNGDI